MSNVIRKVFKTETSHIVRNAVSERCRYNIHGHSYKWHIFINGPTNEKTGMVLDFKELEPIKELIDRFDHATVLWEKEDPKIINFFKDNFRRVLIMKKNTTAENMATYIFRMGSIWLDQAFPRLGYFIERVDVWETETGCASAYGYDDDDVLV